MEQVKVTSDFYISSMNERARLGVTRGVVGQKLEVEKATADCLVRRGYVERITRRKPGRPKKSEA